MGRERLQESTRPLTMVRGSSEEAVRALEVAVKASIRADSLFVFFFYLFHFFLLYLYYYLYSIPSSFVL